MGRDDLRTAMLWFVMLGSRKQVRWGGLAMWMGASGRQGGHRTIVSADTEKPSQGHRNSISLKPGMRGLESQLDIFLLQKLGSQRSCYCYVNMQS